MSFYDLWSAVLIATIAGFVLVFTALMAARLLAPYAREKGKGVSYECGMLPVGRNWAQVHVRYYLIAILFLIFDVETIFIFPWAVTYLAQGARNEALAVMDRALQQDVPVKAFLCCLE